MNQIKELEKELLSLKAKDAERKKIVSLKAQIKAEKFKRTKLGALAGATKQVFGGIGRGVGAIGGGIAKPLTPEQQKAIKANRKKLNEFISYMDVRIKEEIENATKYLEESSMPDYFSRNLDDC